MGIAAAPVRKELSADQIAFVEAYNGDIASTAAQLSIPKHRAYWFLRQAPVADAIREREVVELGEDVEATIANRLERQGFWTEVERDETVELSIRLKASELLAKSQGDFVERIKHEGNGHTVNILVQNVDLEDRVSLLRKNEVNVLDQQRALPEFLT